MTSEVLTAVIRPQKETKGLQTEKEGKNSLFSDNILYIKNTNESIKSSQNFTPSEFIRSSNHHTNY